MQKHQIKLLCLVVCAGSLVAAFELLDAARLASKARVLTVAPATLRLRECDARDALAAVKALVLALRRITTVILLAGVGCSCSVRAVSKW